MNVSKLLAAFVAVSIAGRFVFSAEPVAVHFLEASPPLPTPLAWGVPYPRGAIQKGATFALTTSDSKIHPVQSWPLAYWPDGSIKWMGFAALSDATFTGDMSIDQAKIESVAYVSAKETADGIDINTGNAGGTGLQCHISKSGANIFDTLKIGDRTIAENAQSEMLLQKGLETDPGMPPPRERFTSNVTKVTLEQSGPLRAVVKIEGMHKRTAPAGAAGAPERQFIPFYVRLYFYPGVTPIKTVYSFVYDGDDKEDFIHGLGLTMTVPFAEEIQNRHVRFGGEEGGLWAEPVQPLQTWNVAFTNPGTPNAYAAQLNGARIANRAQLNANSQHNLDALAQWGDFRLQQPNSYGFSIDKRTSQDGGWIPAGQGRRAPGYVFVGDVSGGMGAGVQNFWQSAPAALEVRHARTAAADMHVWLWSPDAPPMDLRHYDTVAHGLNETYEDVEIPYATPMGIAHTTHLTLFPAAGIPSKKDAAAQAALAAQPPQLACTPAYLHEQKAFGVWSLQDKSTPFKKALEEGLDNEMAFYQKAVDQFNWYGFWYFGNVMHGYDANRQNWKYDQGGFAWDNSEQGTDFVAWYMFLRTGRGDLFRYAEAMTRYTGEVICYHKGPMAGLGSRHNVTPWGDGAKEARISMAPYRRFYYYLTTDERTGDVMHEMLQADASITRIDPMRKVQPPTPADAQYPARVRGGPDWFAFAGNWMTEWERTGDTRWRDKIITGMDSIAAMPNGLRTSTQLLWGFYPETGKLVPRDNTSGSYNLVNNMGGPEIVMELNELIDHPGWKKVWFDYCSTGTGRLAAYYGNYAPGLTAAQRTAAIQKAISGVQGGVGADFSNVVTRRGPELFRPLEIPQTLNGLVTNNSNQSSLQLIEVLDLAKEHLPTEAPVVTPGRGRAGRGGVAPAAPGARGAAVPPAVGP